MSTRVSNYAHYILANLIASWDRPYWGDALPDSALAYLSDSVVQSLSTDDVVALRDDRSLKTTIDRASSTAVRICCCASERTRSVAPTSCA